jgi:hypothetical protein
MGVESHMEYVLITTVWHSSLATLVTFLPTEVAASTRISTNPTFSNGTIVQSDEQSSTYLCHQPRLYGAAPARLQSPPQKGKNYDLVFPE